VGDHGELFPSLFPGQMFRQELVCLDVDCSEVLTTVLAAYTFRHS